MKSNQSLLRLRRFEVEEKRRNVSDIQAMIADFERMVQDLDRQIDMEQKRAGVYDVNHYNYPTFAKAAHQRKSNLEESIAGLAAQLETAQDQLMTAEEELAQIQTARDLAESKTERDAQRKSLEISGLADITPIPMSVRGA